MIINVAHVNKTYLIPQQQAGFCGNLKSLFFPVYSQKSAVQDISFSITAGETVGIIGPNGAGKSTLLKMLTGILKPDSGQISLLGRDPFTDRRDCSQYIGVLFGQKSNLWWDLPVMDSFNLYQQLYQVADNDYKRDLDELAKIFELNDLLTKPVRTLSLGQRVRCSIAAVMLQRPKVLFLDEPTIALDIVAIEQLVKILLDMKKNRALTIIIASHDLAVIEKLCNRMLVIDKGQMIFDGSVAQAVEKYNCYKKITVVFARPITDLNEVNIPRGIAVQELLPTQLKCLYKDTVVANDVVLKFVQNLSYHWKIDEFFIERPTLNEVIINAFRQSNA